MSLCPLCQLPLFLFSTVTVNILSGAQISSVPFTAAVPISRRTNPAGLMPPAAGDGWLCPLISGVGCFYGAASSVFSAFTASLTGKEQSGHPSSAKGRAGCRAGLAGGLSSQGTAGTALALPEDGSCPWRPCPAMAHGVTRGHFPGSDCLPMSRSLLTVLMKSRRGTKAYLKDFF